MSSSDRRIFLLSLVALAGCGFQPVHAPGGPAHGLRGRIAVASPSDEEGRALARRLEDRLGLAQSDDLLLSADIRLREEAEGFLADGSISRYMVLGEVEWQLHRGEEVVRRGRERAFTGYSATSTTVATIFAQRDARERLMVILADRIVADLLSGAPV